VVALFAWRYLGLRSFLLELRCRSFLLVSRSFLLERRWQFVFVELAVDFFVQHHVELAQFFVAVVLSEFHVGLSQFFLFERRSEKCVVELAWLPFLLDVGLAQFFVGVALSEVFV
jgi:hypothetical protein